MPTRVWLSQEKILMGIPRCKDHLDSFQYAATSNFGKTKVAFSKRAIPTPSQNCPHHEKYLTLVQTKFI